MLSGSGADEASAATATQRFMLRSYRYFHLDVFTDRLFGGSQLAVVLDGRGLAAETMQAIAKEMNFSETTFVLPPEAAGTNFRVRIFTPGIELPMAGHPTIGTVFALVRAGAIGQDCAATVFGLNIGPTPVSLAWRDGGLSFAWMTQVNPVFGPPIADLGGAAGGLRLPAAAVAGTGLPVQSVSCGVPYLIVPLATRRVVDSASLDAVAYDGFLRANGLDEMPVYLFSSEKTGDQATVYSRMFATGLGVVEDPATGSASGPLGCYLVRHKVVPSEQAGSIVNLQGVAMGRPSYIHIAIGLDGGDISSVRVGGQAVFVGEGSLYV
jgi:trans-2,3-dihydro-3-hydroxyanthranilate isomerase